MGTDPHAHSPELSQEEVAAWRSAQRRRLINGGFSRGAARYRLGQVEDLLRTIAEALHREYGTPHLGNWQDPTDEFVFIVLSRKTAERAYQPAFRALKAAGDWDRVSRMDREELIRQIHGCGLEGKKAAAILEGLQCIRERFGAADLSRAAGLSDSELFEFLAGLPEVGPKSARCVMLYSFGRSTFPVDAHVGRVLARLGCFRRFGIELEDLNHKIRQRLLAETVPPDLRYGLHVNLIEHGRSLCRALEPDCERCPLVLLCDHGRDTRKRKG